MEDREFTPDVTEDDLRALKEEQLILGEADERETAERLFLENLPQAALSIIKLSQNAASDRTRFDASKYIVERNLGRLQDLNSDPDDKLYALLEDLQKADAEVQ